MAKSESERNTERMVDLRPLAHENSENAANGLAKPNVDQLAFQELECGLFIHFGMNTFTGEGTGGRGTENPSVFAPSALDCNNWMEVARSMGARFAVLTARHEEGFCLWPTETTDYSLAQSPFRDGRGDVVEEFVDACRRYDIKPCLYHSSYMDAHHIFEPGDPIRWHKEWFATTNRRLADPQAFERFTAMQVAQIRELLTRYGDITYLWLDHIGETQGILDPSAVDRFWSAIVNEARRLQPHCLLLKADVYLSRDREVGGGVHGGRAAYPLWHTCRRENTPEGQGDPIPDPEGGDQYIVWESNTIFSGGWFWNGPEVKSVDDMMDHYFATVGRGSTFLPNFAPDRRGLMTETVQDRAREFGERVRALSASPLGETSGDGTVLDILLPGLRQVDRVVLMEDLGQGQKIAAYTVSARLPSGEWREIVRGRSVGHKRVERFPQVTANALRFTCTERFAEKPAIRRMSVYGPQEELSSSG